MPVEADVVYKDAETILAELIASWQARVPDVVVTVDSIIRIILTTWAESFSGVMLANQLLHDDMFPQTAQGLTLLRYGDIYGRSQKGGVKATGTLRFSGAPGVVIPSGTYVAAPSTTDESLRFQTSAGATIPQVGVPSAPTLADAGAGALPAGTYEYVVSYQSALGESAPGAISAPITIVINHNINLTAIPIGGTGTTGRRVYRRLNGGVFGLVSTIANNTTTVLTDSNVAPGGAPLIDSTAEQVDVAAIAENVGSDYNALTGTVTSISDSVPGLSSVTNPVAFTGGVDAEDIEDFRGKLLDYIRNPQAGAPNDLKGWAEAIDGVDSATVFQNDNLGVATPGHSTIRISGPNGAVPSAAVQAAVLADIQGRYVANLTPHVGTFTPKSINVTVVLTLAAGYVLADVSASVQKAISDYINKVAIGGTTYEAGVKDAVFGLPGILTLTTTFTDTTSLATEKPVPGTLTVS